MLLLICFAFLAGVITVLSPCILPVLPIILAGSVTEGKRRPLGIVAGFAASFTFFTLFLSAIVKATGISPDLLRQAAIVMIVGFGLSLIIPTVQKWLEKLFTYFSRFAPQQQTQGFWGGVLVGMSLGLIWTPCVGPILAAIISLAISGEVTVVSLFITLAYALGTSLPMLGIMQGGRQLLNKMPWLTQNTQQIQRGFGVVMILIGIAIGFNIDRSFQTWVLTVFPTYGQGLTKLEQNYVVQDQLARLQQTSDNMGTAPDFTGGGQWLNSEPLTMADLRGKVVLVDFWTYTCINCIRTLPYVTKWYETYKDKNFVVVGVHSPEFAFEQVTVNVQTAITDHSITYPVVQDNDFKIWRAYQNQYWPAHYLIDKNGVIRYTHFGEGEYIKTENKIRELLDEVPLTEETEVEGGAFRAGQTPELYLGLDRASAYMQPRQLKLDQVVDATFGKDLDKNHIDLQGKWLADNEFIESKATGSQLILNFQAGQVILVLAPTAETKQPAYVKVLLDGQPVPAQHRPTGMDEQGRLTVSSAKEYVLVDLGGEFGRHTLQLEFDEGIQAYAFTFGVGSK